MQQKHVDILGWVATVTAVLMYVSYIDQIRLNLTGHQGSVVQPAAGSRQPCCSTAGCG